MKTRLLLLPLLALLFAACDSNDDDSSDLDVLIGTHQAVKIEDGTGDQTAAFATIVEAFRVTVNANGTYRLVIDYNATGEAAGRTDFDASSTYALSESAKTLTLQIPISATTQVPVTFTYAIVSDNTVRFTTTQTALFNQVLGTSYAGNLIVTVQRVS